MKTLKALAILFFGSLLFVGCETSSGNGGKEDNYDLILVADKNIIYDDGVDAANLTVWYKGEVIEPDAIYDGDNMDQPIGNVFTSTERGTHKLWASYGTLLSKEVSINVIATPPPAPEAPVDNNPTKTNFVRRVLLTQFTGTGCPHCPSMMNALYLASNSTTVGDKAVIAAAHLFNDSDIAYLSEAKTLDDAMGITSFPNIVADLDSTTKITQTNGGSASLAYITSIVNNSINRVSTKGGIAVNAEYLEDVNYVVITATVKAKETAEFRIGAWLLEDGISAGQENYGYQPVEGVNFNIHNNCIRIANSNNTSTDFSGFSLGTIEAGKTATKEFSFVLKEKGDGSATRWNHDNLRVIVFISTKEGNTWLVNNVVKCPKDGSVDFEYEN